MGHQGMRTATAFLLAAMMPLVGCAGGAGQDDAVGSESPSATGTADPSGLKTELGRKILEDGKVTDAEWEEAKQAFIDCNAQHGLTIEFSDSGGFSSSGHATTAAEGEAEGEINKQCMTDTDFDRIEQVHNSAKETAKHGDTEEYLQSVVDCLTSNGLVDKGMTVEEYKQDLSDTDKRNTVFGKYIDSSNPDYDEQKAQQWRACSDDPSQSAPADSASAGSTP